MASGGCCRSESMVITRSPVASDSPALNASWWPKLRESLTPRNRGSRAAVERIRLHVRSFEPSSTRRTSHSWCVASRTAVNRSTSSGMASSSSWAGSTTLSFIGRDYGSDRYLSARVGSTGATGGLGEQRRGARGRGKGIAPSASVLSRNRGRLRNRACVHGVRVVAAIRHPRAGGDRRLVLGEPAERLRRRTGQAVLRAHGAALPPRLPTVRPRHVAHVRRAGHDRSEPLERAPGGAVRRRHR